ncbi:MAG: tetraacyldisaccharide 4'-kinase [Deltaproteobacteria bacterium]|nr:MAG: tetraacyldisaccharide 4'-kinase [Deltaproteobacteria bacterium]
MIPRLQNRIQKVIIQADTDDQRLSRPVERILYTCSRIYELAVRLRIYLYENGIFKQRSLPCKVISIGNITVGGTGKTPMTQYIANLLKGFGLKVAVLSRGYGGLAQGSGGIVSDGNKILMPPDVSGDEPQLLASGLNGIPVLVGKDRYRAGRQAIESFAPSVLVLDDAFQHLALKRDLNLLLLDSATPFGNGHCLPRGRLREPPEQILRASAFIFTRWTGKNDLTQATSMVRAHAGERPVFKCAHVPESLFLPAREEFLDPRSLKNRRLFAFSGIARNDNFRNTLSDLGADIAGFQEFPDHHRYSSHDLETIWKMARDLNVDNIVTTEKDYINIQTEIPPTPELLVLTISISFGNEAETFANYLKSKLIDGN